MQLEWELLLAFPGIGGMQGICHIRAYEASGYRPVVIAGELTDNPGTYIPNAIETLAHTVQEHQYHNSHKFCATTARLSHVQRCDRPRATASSARVTPRDQTQRRSIISFRDGTGRDGTGRDRGGYIGVRQKTTIWRTASPLARRSKPSLSSSS